MLYSRNSLGFMSNSLKYSQYSTLDLFLLGCMEYVVYLYLICSFFINFFGGEDIVREEKITGE